MHFNTLVFSQLLLPVLGQSTYSKSVCITKYGTKSINPPLPSSSTTKAFTFTALRMTWIVPSVTITPKPKTTTTVVDVTSTITSAAPRETDTFHTTITVDTTLTNEVIETALVTQVTETTLTLPGPTFTVTTNPGHVPIKSVPTWVQPQARSVGHARRISKAAVTPAAAAAFEVRQKNSEKVFCEIKDGKFHVPGKYPASVGCENNIKVITTKTHTFKWWKTATVTAPRPTITSTITRVHTTTTVITPVKASTTISDFTTNTFSKMTTTTTSVTTTMTATETISIAATSTVYPGCQDPANYFGEYEGRYVQNYNYITGVEEYRTQTGRAPSAERCCEMCFDTPLCFSSTWVNDGNCFMFVGTGSFQCSPSTIMLRYFLSHPGFTLKTSISNGNCGQMQFGIR